MSEQTIAELFPCRKCGQSFPRTTAYFYAHSMMKDGLLKECKTCFLQAAHQRYVEKRAQFLCRNKRYYTENRVRLLQAEKERRKTDQASISIRRAAYRKKNRAKILQQKKAYRLRHRASIRARDKAYKSSVRGRQTVAAWREKTREKRRERHRQYCQQWLRANPARRISHEVAVLINKSLVHGKQGKSWQRILPYSLAELLAHLAAQFQPGMTWENYGRQGWHIDHRRPIAAFHFTSIEDAAFQECWALANLQPLWEQENLSKGAKILP